MIRMKGYVCGDSKKLLGLEVPELGKEGTGAWDQLNFGKDVCEYLTAMQTKGGNPIGGNYDKLLKNVDRLCKESSGSINNPGMFLCKHGILDILIVYCKTYLEKGGNEERKSKIKILLEQLESANRLSKNDITSAGMNGNRTFKDLDDGIFDEIPIDGVLAKQFQSRDAKYKFKNNSNLKKVVISSDVEKIPTGAFVNCSKLEEICVENRLKELNVEEGAINGCHKFSEMTGDLDKVNVKDDAIINCQSYRESNK